MKKFFAAIFACCFMLMGALSFAACDEKKTKKEFEGIYTAYSFVTEDGTRYGLGSIVGGNVLQDRHILVALAPKQYEMNDYGEETEYQNMALIWYEDFFGEDGISLYYWEKSEDGKAVIATDGTNEQWIKCDGETLVMRFEKAEWTFKKYMSWAEVEDNMLNSSYPENFD